MVFIPAATSSKLVVGYYRYPAYVAPEPFYGLEFPVHKPIIERKDFITFDFIVIALSGVDLSKAWCGGDCFHFVGIASQ